MTDTTQLYLEDSELRSFEATVEAVSGDRVVLDRTAFYPEGGGQPADHGWLYGPEGRDWRVTDVQKGAEIFHHVEGEPPEAGTTLTAELDWDRRHAHMRYHTAQHLLSAVLLEEFDAETTGNQLYEDRARLDCAYPRFEDDDLDRIEERVNEYVERSIPVDWYTLDREEAEEQLDPERTRLELLPDSITEVRLVEITGVDRTACAGTHVSNTEEVGEFVVTGRETRGSEEERVRFELR
ncbi:alanyl-tRNA editing protein [Halospeciosus flavus]|uniref:Alanine--tRNA ligase-related protein n=1 Tax=Halospeciosus flavus TaxID=3032283 RepID=A0ABD5Z4C5_9EURY|nr:alanyl-tRNA editing protein [Halospeciosus flavus]